MNALKELLQTVAPIDLIMLCLVVYFGLKGLIHGFVREFASLAGMVLGAWLAFTQSDWLAAQIIGLMPGTINKTVALLISVVFLLLAGGLLCSLIGRLLSAVISFAWLNALDRLLGLALGIAKVLVFALVLVYFADLIPGWHVEQSVTGQIALKAFKWLLPFLPDLSKLSA